MPRSQKDNERVRQLAKENIRTSAMEIFIEKGYHRASIDDVARRAGVSKGLMYNYYKGKEELLAEMVEHRVREIKTVMEAAARLEAPADQLMHIIDGAIDNVYERPQVFRFYLHLQTQPEEDLALAKYSRMLNREMAEQFKVQTRMFERLGAVQPQVRSLYFSSTLQGIMLMISIYPEHYPVSDIKKQLIREFCKAD